ncbi:YrbL family protein [Loktanella sp. R86503]|uniref:YrbL family protein n=1 Tax=Loktanella sp. R86503 TaxID=3093847 RepID=UPI0036DCC29F
MKKTAVVPVSHLTWIAKGCQRLVFIHPDDDTKILKVPYSGLMMDTVLRNAPIANKQQNRHIAREHRVYRRNRRRLAQQPFDAPIPFFYGTIRTDIGNADVYEGLFRQNRSKLALTLGQVVRRDLFRQKALDDLNAFVTRLDAWNIPATDITAQNIVYGFRGDRRVFVLVDGFGDYRKLPVASWSRRIRLQRTSDAYSRIAKRLGIVWDAEGRSFHHQ